MATAASASPTQDGSASTRRPRPPRPSVSRVSSARLASPRTAAAAWIGGKTRRCPSASESFFLTSASLGHPGALACHESTTAWSSARAESTQHEDRMAASTDMPRLASRIGPGSPTAACRRIAACQ